MLGALAVVAALSAASPAAAQTQPARPPARLEVAGVGSVERSPDQAVITFSIVTNDDNASRATSANNGIYAALAAKMRALGIDAAAIKTTGYDLNFNPRPAQPNPQFEQRFGYVVTRSVAVTAPHTDQAGPLIDAAVAAGVTSVGGVSFGLRDARAAQRAALAAAVADAGAQAEALAGAAHVRIVRILAITTAPAGLSPRPIMQLGRMAPAMAAVPTDVQPSNLSVTANATVTYEIAP